jgi:tRNA nucleotidyltransferase (CCA-adding enzyme)
MAKLANMASRIEEQMSAKLVDFIKAAGRVAQRQRQRLYLVGGVVRDLFLERNNLDLDLVVEGDAIDLAHKLADINEAKITSHARFGTAKLQCDNKSIDVASARAESYVRPGALPKVKPGTVKNDLARRDFTINAMAIELTPSHFGRLLDPYRGRYDLEHKLVRVLHQNSFVDDATRIWRALRYEQRLDFKIEPATLELLKRDIAMLDTISGDRIRNELELTLKEDLPEKVLLRADELGVLNNIHLSLKAGTWLADTFVLARQQYRDSPSPWLYLALLAYHLTANENEQLIIHLRLPRTYARVIRDTMAIKDKIGELSINGLAPSRIYSLLHGYNSTAITANSLATDSASAQEHIELYQNVLRYIQSALTGEDIKKLGIPEGPKIKEILQKLRAAKLDGEVGIRKDEEELVRGWIKTT